MTGRLGGVMPLAVFLACAVAGCSDAQQTPQPRPPSVEGERANFVNKCAGDLSDGTAAAYVGKTEGEAAALAQTGGEVIRVTGRDGQCLGGDRANRRERVNPLVLDGEVIWARRG